MNAEAWVRLLAVIGCLGFTASVIAGAYIEATDRPKHRWYVAERIATRAGLAASVAVLVVIVGSWVAAPP